MDKHTISLQNGTHLNIRPVEAQDAAKIYEMHRRLSAESLTLRYFRPFIPSLEEIEQVCHLGGAEGQTLVAILDDEAQTVVGLACYVIERRGQPLTAEPAILIEDQFQGQGLGRRLWQQLQQQAQAQGINIFNIFVHLSNFPMMALVRSAGLPFEAKFLDGARQIRIELGTGQAA